MLAALERDHAIRVKPEWLSQCLAFLRTKAPGSMRIATLVTFVVEQFLVADLRAIGAPAIPGNAALLATLPGPLVLQVPLYPTLRSCPYRVVIFLSSVLLPFTFVRTSQ